MLDDFDVATQILKDEQNVDMLNPGSSSDPLSYREIAMREEFRVDLGDGLRITEIRQAMEKRMRKRCRHWVSQLLLAMMEKE